MFSVLTVSELLCCYAFSVLLATLLASMFIVVCPDVYVNVGDLHHLANVDLQHSVMPAPQSDRFVGPAAAQCREQDEMVQLVDVQLDSHHPCLHADDTRHLLSLRAETVVEC